MAGYYRVQPFFNSDQIALIRTYRTPVGNPCLPIPHRYTHGHTWDDGGDAELCPGVVGVELEQAIYSKGRLPLWFHPNGKYCGPASAWLNGADVDDYTDLGWTAWGVSLCCLRKQGFRGILAGLGDQDGGTAVQIVLWTQQGLGGDLDGGPAVFNPPFVQTATGGDTDGGAAAIGYPVTVDGPGTFDIVVPAGIYLADFTLWGGGGGGATSDGVFSGAGAGAGESSLLVHAPVTPGETLTAVLGDGGSPGSLPGGSAGGDASLSRGLTLLGEAIGGDGGTLGGIGGVGGSGGVGDFLHSGGTGGGAGATGGGGGGGAGGLDVAGGDGGDGDGVGGAGGIPGLGGGAGGPGGGTAPDGGAGDLPGGGGGGGSLGVLVAGGHGGAARLYVQWLLSPAVPGQTGHGGDLDGGAATFTGTVPATGGDTDGGPATWTLVFVQSATGGDTDGGPAVWTWEESATGGDRDGGAATWASGQTAHGGDLDGGPATWASGQTAGGGDRDGGAARYPVVQSATGGDMDGGPAVWTWEESATGGDRDGGAAAQGLGVVTVLKDLFAGTAGTTLPTHTPNVGGPWVAVTGAWALDGSGHAYPQGTNSVVQVATVAADFTLTVDVTSRPLQTASVYYRYTNASNRWQVGVVAGSLTVVKTVGGAVTSFGPYVITTVSGATKPLQIIASGSTVSILWNNLPVVTITDAALATAVGIGLGGGRGATPSTFVFANLVVTSP